MRKIRRFIVVVAVVLAVNAPAAAMAGPFSDACQSIEDEIGKYGWHAQICPTNDPLD